MTRARVLFVDDEANLLAGMQMNLRRDFEVLIANHGEEALTILAATPDLAVLVCDMRMPRMNGAAVLTRACQIAPAVTRILLTGQSDVSLAISAVNDGQIFRFLTKPCERAELVASLHAAVRQHELVTAEKVLVQQTLRGAVAALVDVLSLASPLAFGRATRVKKHAARLAEAMEVADPWQLELAVSMQSLGYISLTAETLEKLYAGHLLNDDEQRQVARMPAMTEQILAHIPRLEQIRAILAVAARQAAWSGVAGEGPTELAGAILRLANDADAIETSGMTGAFMVKLLRQRGGHPPYLLDAFETLLGEESSTHRIVELALSALRVGMVVAEDILLNGTLLVSRGYTVTASFLERARHFAEGAVREPIRVLMMTDAGVDQRISVSR
ncbi:MAG: response regulator [Kofleriaceae bacterium]